MFTDTTMTIQEQRHQAFEKELKELLKKHKAELTLEEFGRGNWSPGEFKMVVEFDWDAVLCEQTGSGTIDQLILGSFVDKD